MGEPQALGQGPPTQRNCMVTGRAARYRSIRRRVIQVFRAPPANANHANHANDGRANPGAIL
jgi:hypothetical protein